MRYRAIIVLMVIFFSRVASQTPTPITDSPDDYLRFEDDSFISCLTTYFPSVFIKNEIDLKIFLRSKKFRSLRREFGDRRAMDFIFVRAMRLTNNNTAMALLLTTFSCFDHRTLGFKIPIFNLFFPLSNESEEEFHRRLSNLPAHLFADSPADTAGDRDKLQHFFGSAFLTYIFESKGSADRFGEFIEQGEDAIVVGGVNDERDKRANREGQRFGQALLEDNHRLPSELLRKSLTKEKVSFMDSHCVGVW